MSQAAQGQRGFTLIELMVVIVILGIVVSLAIPSYFDNIRHTRETQCLVNRKATERAAIAHYNTFDRISGNTIPSVEELVDLGYFDIEPECPCEGIYVWEQNNYSEDRLPRLGCSIHYIPESASTP